jgi:hypothetical protein
MAASFSRKLKRPTSIDLRMKPSVVVFQPVPDLGQPDFRAPGDLDREVIFVEHGVGVPDDRGVTDFAER